MIFTVEKLSPPNPDCLVCRKNVALAKCDMATTSVSDLLEAFGTTEVTLSEGARILYDPELEEHVHQPLKRLGLAHGAIVQLDPEDGTLSSWIYILVDRREATKEPNKPVVTLQILYQTKKVLKRTQEGMDEVEEADMPDTSDQEPTGTKRSKGFN